MNTANRNRLAKLESHAASLLLEGGPLIRQGERLSVGELTQWWEQRSNHELEAIRRADGGMPVDWDRFNIAELEQIARDGILPLRRVQL